MKHIHGTCLSIDGCGVILRGPPSSGKSDLALRLIKEGAQLVADDQIFLSSSSEGLFASAPKKLAGLIEVRGVGIIKLESVENVRVEVVVDLVKRNQISRMQDFLTVEIFGVPVPSILLFPFEVSASAKLTVALKVVTGKSILI